MRDPIVFVGDEVTAAGFRLAGIGVRVPRPGGELAALLAACGEASVVLLGAACAATLPQPVLESALAGLAPLVVIVPDATGREPPADPAAKVRRLLGVNG